MAFLVEGLFMRVLTDSVGLTHPKPREPQAVHDATRLKPHLKANNIFEKFEDAKEKFGRDLMEAVRSSLLPTLRPPCAPTPLWGLWGTTFLHRRLTLALEGLSAPT